MEIKVYKPQSRLLQKYIECFYTLKRKPEEKDIIYVAFPNTFTIVCLNADSIIKPTGEGNLTFTHCPSAKLRSSLMCDYKYSGWVKYEGEADEIVIYFKPLGINEFLEKNLRYYVNSFVDKFNPFDDYQAAMMKIFSLDNDADRIETLENYWLSKRKGFQHPFIRRVVDDLIREGETSSIAETARKYKISRPTLIKHFDSHICTTPSQFKKVVRFRKAMEHYRNKISLENLVDISYAADYFDQSHMIRDFKCLTKYSPKTFFSKISTLEDGQINWLFL